MGNVEFSIIKSFKTSSSLTVSERLNRLSFEAKILTYIGFHDNVVSCYGISMINSNPSLVLSYESNMTLHDYLKQNQVPTTECIIRVLSSLSGGVLHLHRKGVIHNQIVAANICLRYQTKVY